MTHKVMHIDVDQDGVLVGHLDTGEAFESWADADARAAALTAETGEQHYADPPPPEPEPEPEQAAGPPDGG